MRLALGAAAGVIGSLMTISPSAAGCRGSQCFERVEAPPVYATRYEKVQIAPARRIAHVQPARYGTAPEVVVVQPARNVARYVPAEVRTVAEKVLVAPASKRWQVTRDAYGRTIGCWVHVPAQYAVRHRQVVVRPERVDVERVPEVLGVRQRTVMIRPQTVSHEYVPPQYGLVGRTVQVAPASAHWRRLRPGY